MYGVLILSFGSGILAAVFVHFVIRPYLKNKILKEVNGASVSFSKVLEEKDVTGKLDYCKLTVIIITYNMYISYDLCIERLNFRTAPYLIMHAGHC